MKYIEALSWQDIERGLQKPLRGNSKDVFTHWQWEGILNDIVIIHTDNEGEFQRTMIHTDHRDGISKVVVTYLKNVVTHWHWEGI